MSQISINTEAKACPGKFIEAWGVDAYPIQEMNIIDGAMATKFASDIKADPRVILPLLTKISEALIAAPPGEGAGIEKEAAADGADASDPDGWGAFARGQPVKLKP